MKTQNLSVDLIRTDADTQSRVTLNEDAIEDYAAIIVVADGEWPFPPLDVFHDGTREGYFVADGFHRYFAGKRAKRGSFPCIIHSGTAFDAKVFAMTANDRHGMRMTRADKRACIEWLLDSGGKITQKQIAEYVGVTSRTVRVVVAERRADSEKRGHLAKAGQVKTSVRTTENRKTSHSDGLGNGQSSQSNGEDGGTDADAQDAPTDDGHRSPEGGTEQPVADLGKCPNCLRSKWTSTPDGYVCAKCNHPHGEPTGGSDDDVVATQKAKTRKTAEALMRAFDDLNEMAPGSEHEDAIAHCKELLRIVRDWK